MRLPERKRGAGFLSFDVAVKTGVELTPLGAWVAHPAALPFLVTAVTFEASELVFGRILLRITDLGKNLD